MSKIKKVYYHIELPLETVKLLSHVCELHAGIIAGDAKAIEEIVANAYKERIGREPSESVTETIRNLSKELIAIGWDTNSGTKYSHRYRKETDTLCDISEVLRYQMALRVETSEIAVEPCHWNEDVELPRIVKIVESGARRTKQLRIVQ